MVAAVDSLDRTLALGTLSCRPQHTSSTMCVSVARRKINKRRCEAAERRYTHQRRARWPARHHLRVSTAHHRLSNVQAQCTRCRIACVSSASGRYASSMQIGYENGLRGERSRSGHAGWCRAFGAQIEHACACACESKATRMPSRGNARTLKSNCVRMKGHANARCKGKGMWMQVRANTRGMHAQVHAGAT